MLSASCGLQFGCAIKILSHIRFGIRKTGENYYRLPVHYLILNGEVRNLYTDIQTRWLFLYFASGTLVLTGILYVREIYETAIEALRYGFFQFVSASSCTGFQTADTETGWTAGPTLPVSLGILTGGAAGSTVGGIKLVRVITLVKGRRGESEACSVPTPPSADCESATEY